MNTSATQKAKFTMPETNNQYATHHLNMEQLVHDEHTETVHEPSDPVHEVLNLPELHERILTYLPIKDLTRTLAVSKQWHQVILGSIKLRRTLFLEPIPAADYLVGDGSLPFDFVPYIVHELGQYTKLIVEAHPVLQLVGYDKAIRVLIVEAPPLEVLKKVPPSTLLFQPPLETIDIRWNNLSGCISVARSGGVTFSTLLKVYETLKARYKQLGRPFVERFMIWSTEAVFSDTCDVVHARWKALHGSSTTQGCPCGRCRRRTKRRPRH